MAHHDDVTAAFVAEARETLGLCARKIVHCLRQLSDEDLNWRPFAGANSIANVVTALPRTVATLLGGAVASLTHGYRVGFALSAVLALISLLLTLRVTEPRIKVERPLPPGP